MSELYELFLGTWAIAYSDTSPALARQAPIRLAVLLGDSVEPWSLV